MDLSIVIVNWKVRDLLERCLTSIYRETSGLDFEVFVVDNDSRDGSVEMVAKRFPQAELIASNRNLGFAAANNEAVARSRGEFILLLNPDTEILDGALQKLVAFMRRERQAAICGPKLVNADGTLQPSVRRFPTLAVQAAIMLKLHRVWPGMAGLRRYLAADLDYAKASACDQVMGAALMFRRSLLEDIGMLDAGYFVWFEEVDFCKTAAEKGYQTWYTPEAVIKHHGGESFGQVLAPRKQKMFNASARRYFRKHHGRPAWFALLLLHPLSMLLAYLSGAGAPARKKV